MACKFKHGDRVRVGNKAGKVKSISYGVSGCIYGVEFDDAFSVPPEKYAHENDLEFLKKEENKNFKKCTCGTEATFGKVPAEKHAYYCDLINSKEKEKEKFKIEKDDEDYLLEQFELMLGIDDDDGFGFFD
jgi:hypothetical protein